MRTTDGPSFQAPSMARLIKLAVVIRREGQVSGASAAWPLMAEARLCGPSVKPAVRKRYRPRGPSAFPTAAGRPREIGRTYRVAGSNRGPDFATYFEPEGRESGLPRHFVRGHSKASDQLGQRDPLAPEVVDEIRPVSTLANLIKA